MVYAGEGLEGVVFCFCFLNWFVKKFCLPLKTLRPVEGVDTATSGGCVCIFGLLNLV